MPPFSTRTLQHPSFLPLYLCADLELSHTDFKNQTGESHQPQVCHWTLSECATLLSTLVSSPIHHPNRVFPHWPQRELRQEDPKHSEWAKGECIIQKIDQVLPALPVRSTDPQNSSYYSSIPGQTYVKVMYSVRGKRQKQWDLRLSSRALYQAVTCEHTQDTHTRYSL